MKDGNAPVDMSPARDAKKKRRQRENKRERGLVQMTIFVHPTHRARVRAYNARLLAKLERTGEEDS